MSAEISLNQSPAKSSAKSLAQPLSGTEFANYLLQQRPVIFPAKDLVKDQANWLENFQSLNSDRLPQIPFPTVKQEEWKYTDVSSLLRFPWKLLPSIEQTSELNSALSAELSGVKQLISTHILPESSGSLIVFVNGIFAPNFSNIQNLPSGLISTRSDITSNIALDGDRLRQYLKLESEDYFATLNNACFQDLLIVNVPPNTKIDRPLQILFVHSLGENTLSEKDGDKAAIAHNRCLVIVGKNSELNLIQTIIGIDSQTYCTNSVTQIWLEQNAKVSHSNLQHQGNQAFDLATTQVYQAKESCYLGQQIALGAKLSRHNLQIQQQGEGAITELDGLAMINDQQLADTHSIIAHKFANGTSRQMHKSVVSDRSHAVFSGKIEVAKAAQMTNSSQLSRNLLLSDQAKVETQPQLEILADNVKCAHGATVSQLESEEIFYLQSRGIDADRAVNLLTFGFAAEVIAKIPFNSLRESLNKYVLNQVQARDLDQASF